MTSIPRLGVLQPVVLYPALSCAPCSPGEADSHVHSCGDNLPVKPPTSNPALTSNSESGNFKYKQTSLPQTTSGAISQGGQRGRGHSWELRAPCPPLTPLEPRTPRPDKRLQMGASGPG